MEVRFKYVGQGDSIIVEWTSSGESKIGIIDCKSIEGTTPSIEHIRSRDRIEFIILTHPHSDHFSGLPSLLQFCEDRQIEIGLFVYTTREILPYIKSLVLSTNERDALADTFRKVQSLENSGLLKSRAIGSDHMQPISLTADAELRLIAPSEQERDQFAQTSYDNDLAVGDDYDANLVCAVTLIEGEGWQIILTADAMPDTLKRIGLGPLKRDYTNLLVGQVPHHGSQKNHYRAFWKNRNHKDNTPMVISVGPNGYGHPAFAVIKDLQSLNFDVHTTWKETSSSVSTRSIDLDLISKKSGDSGVEANRDLRYVVDEQECSVTSYSERQ